MYGYRFSRADCNPAIYDSRNHGRHKCRSRKQPIGIRKFSYEELEKATNGFSVDRLLGNGSQGRVYKGVMNRGKLIAAVKKTPYPVENELDILSRIQHPRLVNLIGFCDGDKEREKLLVVEFMLNGSLHDLLHGSSTPLGWARRIRMALQIAESVLALHQQRSPVIHRDIKSLNVLIDENWNARLSDFGLAVDMGAHSALLPAAAGTLGYMDPAYVDAKGLSTKTDVFSFGVLLLEIMSGRKAMDAKHSPPCVADWAVPLIKHGEFRSVCDCRLKVPDDLTAIRAVAVLAARCVAFRVEKRPSMEEAVHRLAGVSKKLVFPGNWTNRIVRRFNLK